jgi:hypothetical protein
MPSVLRSSATKAIPRSVLRAASGPESRTDPPSTLTEPEASGMSPTRVRNKARSPVHRAPDAKNLTLAQPERNVLRLSPAFAGLQLDRQIPQRDSRNMDFDTKPASIPQTAPVTSHFESGYLQTDGNVCRERLHRVTFQSTMNFVKLIAPVGAAVEDQVLCDQGRDANLPSWAEKPREQSFAAATKLVSQSWAEAGNRPAEVTKGPIGCDFPSSMWRCRR